MPSPLITCRRCSASISHDAQRYRAMALIGLMPQPPSRQLYFHYLGRRALLSTKRRRFSQADYTVQRCQQHASSARRKAYFATPSATLSRASAGRAQQRRISPCLKARRFRYFGTQGARGSRRHRHARLRPMRARAWRRWVVGTLGAGISNYHDATDSA